MAPVDQLIREIEIAFASVKRGNGLTLHEAFAFEGTDYATPAERARARALDPETCWQEIPDSVLDKCADGFAFEEEGFYYHLPAYMRWYLRHHQELAPFRHGALFHHLWLTGHKEKTRVLAAQSFEKFTLPQKHLIARFLEFMALESSEAGIRDLAEQAWQSYWHQYRESSAATRPPSPDQTRTFNQA